MLKGDKKEGADDLMSKPTRELVTDEVVSDRVESDRDEVEEMVWLRVRLGHSQESREMRLRCIQ